MNQWQGMPVYLAQVEYKMERPLISPNDLFNASATSLPGSSFGLEPAVREPDLLKKMAFVKHNNWRYEKEWRIICPFKNPSERYLEFPRENVLTGIIFGLRTSDSDRQRILKAIEVSDPQIKIYEAKEDESQFKVQIEGLQKNDPSRPPSGEAASPPRRPEARKTCSGPSVCLFPKNPKT